MTTEAHIDPTQEAGRIFFARGIEGPVVMLNLLRFRAVADYAKSPELAPPSDISGREAYQRYVAHTIPFLQAAGGDLVLMGQGGQHLIGPLEERWDVVLLIQYPSAAAFMSFATNPKYLAGMGHRTAALEDSRLLPIVPSADGTLP